MTFFNTLANLGNMWPDTFFLWFVDVITYKVGYYFKAQRMSNMCIIYTPDLMFILLISPQDCNPLKSAMNSTLATPTVTMNSTILDHELVYEQNFCLDEDEESMCKKAGGECDVTTDGYYILCLASAAFGMVWLVWAWRTIKRLQEIDIMEWRVTRSKGMTCYGLTDVIVKKVTGLKK